MDAKEQKFWEFVKFVGWPCDYKQAEKRIVKQYTLEESREFYSEAARLAGLLHKAIEKAKITDLNCGDDGYSDLLRHIVGLGQEEFYKNLKKPSLIKARCNSDQYEECFTYCIPSEDDYVMANPEKGKEQYRNRAAELAKVVERIEQIDPNRSLEKYYKLFGEIIAATDIIKRNSFEEFMSYWSFHDITRKLKAFTKWYEENQNDLPHRLHTFFHSEFHEHAFYNLYSDIVESIDVWSGK